MNVTAPESTQVASPTQALTGSPAADQPYLIQAVEKQGAGDTATAEHMFKEFLAVYPGNPIATYSIAVILLQRKDRAEALRLLQIGVQSAPGFAPLWLAKASCEQGLGLREEALKSYDQALQIKPDYIEALVNSGALLREVARHAGVSDDATWLPTAQLEFTFGRFAEVVQGRPASMEGMPLDGEFAATLLILRELTHHLAFDGLHLLPAAR